MGTTEMNPITGKLSRPTRVRYRVLAVACSVAVVTYIHRVGFARALPRLGLGDRDASLLTAVFLVAYGIFEVPCGLLSDRLGSRHLLTLLVLGGSLTTGAVALAGFLPEFWVLPFLLGIRFLFGMFQAGAFPVLSRMMTDWMPRQERASAQGLIWMSSRLGGMIVPLLLGWLMVVLGGWESPLWLIAGLGALWCALFWPWFRNRPEEMAGVNAAEQALIQAGRVPRSAELGHVPWARLLESRSVVGLCLMYGCGGFASNFYVTLLPTYLRHQRHLSDAATSLLSSLPFACGMGACLVGGFVSDWIIRRTGNRKWGRRCTGALGMALGSLAWLLVSVVEGPVALAVVLCLIFFCNDLNMGPAWASCADVGEDLAGTVGGAMNMIGSWAGAVGNLVAGSLFYVGRPEWVFILYAGSFGLGCLCWFLVDVTRPLMHEA